MQFSQKNGNLFNRGVHNTVSFSNFNGRARDCARRPPTGTSLPPIAFGKVWVGTSSSLQERILTGSHLQETDRGEIEAPTTVCSSDQRRLSTCEWDRVRSACGARFAVITQFRLLRVLHKFLRTSFRNCDHRTIYVLLHWYIMCVNHILKICPDVRFSNIKSIDQLVVFIYDSLDFVIS